MLKLHGGGGPCKFLTGAPWQSHGCSSEPEILQSINDHMGDLGTLKAHYT